jgi:heterodisulfide reductase subunit C1
MGKLYDELKKDVRYIEGLKACFNCGICTAVCPAAEVSDYDPRIVVNIVQQKDEEKLEQLLKSDTIWRCGECLSCKTRCPRGNTPGYIIQALRALSIETGFFAESPQGRKQLALKRTVGDHILEYGYCVYIDEVDNEMYPEQGPVWDWLRRNSDSMMDRLGTSYKKDLAGTLRNTAPESLKDLKKIFDETGGTRRFEKIERYSSEKAAEMGKEFSKGKDEYFRYMYNETDTNFENHKNQKKHD